MSKFLLNIFKILVTASVEYQYIHGKWKDLEKRFLKIKGGGGGGGEGDLLLICNESCILIDRDIPH